jgi:uncharacterized membrane protein
MATGSPLPPPPPLPSAGATYADVLTRLSTVSSRISDLLRTLGIGPVGHRVWIVLTATIAVLGLLFDLLQAVASYWVANRLRRKMEAENKAQEPYPYNNLLYRSQTFFFVVKSVLMPVATGSIIVLLFIMVLRPQPDAPAPAASPACCCPAGPASAFPTPTAKTPGTGVSRTAK